MKLIVINNDGGFEVQGSDAASIVKLISAPTWVAESLNAWLVDAGDEGNGHTIHVAPGFVVIVPEDHDLKARRASIREKFATYSDFHKDLYGFRPVGISHLCPEEIAAMYDRVSADFARMKSTPEGRDRLRATGWEIEDEPQPAPVEGPAKVAKAPARKVAAKKAARRPRT
jgi:hypothetical protein